MAASVGAAGTTEPGVTSALTSADYYADSYSHFGIHEEMLKDENDFLFAGKTVLDVGCGTGILSLFAAKAGAAHVYAVDMSSIADTAREIVKANGYADRITVFKCKVEDLMLPVDKVDIIISEWMGYFLFYESMLDTVLLARDRWLAPSGLIFPDKAVMHLTAIEDAEYRAEKIDWWDNVYGFDYSVVKTQALAEPLVDTVDAAQICCSSAAVKTIDLLTCRKEDAQLDTPFSLKVIRNDFIHAFAVWFDCQFTCCHKPIAFSTGPRSKATHWKQTVFYLPECGAVSTGEVITGRICSAPNAQNPRDLEISIEYDFQGKRGRMAGKQHYKMR